MRICFLMAVLTSFWAGLLSASELWCVLGNERSRAAAGQLIEWRETTPGGGFDVLEVSRWDQVPREADYLLILGNEADVKASKRDFYRWRSSQQEQYVSDWSSVDWDKDGHPDVAVGRIPTSDPALLRKVADKIVRYEKSPPALGSLKLPVWMGTPAAGKAADELATFLMQRALAVEGPGWSDRWLLMGNPRDTYSAFGNPQDALFNREISRGGMMSFFMGHGSTGSFLSFSDSERSYGYSVSSANRFQGMTPAAPSILFACDCGDFSGDRVSLAEGMLYAENGPVAVIAATTESHPLTNYYSGRVALDALRSQFHQRLGDFWMAVQKAAFERSEPWAELTLSGVEGMLENELNITRLKDDHTMMYALTGDPATRLASPRPLEVDWKEISGGGWQWEVTKSALLAGGELTLGHRPPSPKVVRALPEGTSAEASLEMFEKRNETLVFKEMEGRKDTDSWSGTVRERGDWRIAVVTSQAVFVAAHQIP